MANSDITEYINSFKFEGHNNSSTHNNKNIAEQWKSQRICECETYIHFRR